MLLSINGVARLTRAPELRFLPNSTAVLKLGLACSQKRKDGSGNTVEDKCFIDGVLFGKRAETLASWLHVGSRIQIKGMLKYETWIDQTSGIKRSKHIISLDNIDLMDSKGDSQAPQQNYGNDTPSSDVHDQNQKQQPAMDQNRIPEIDIDEDEIPFAPIGLQYPAILHSC